MNAPASPPSLPGIYSYDWRYRVGFDPTLAKSVREAIRTLPQSNRHIIEETLTWSESFVSLACLVEVLSAGEEVKLPRDVPTNILHAPPAVAEALGRKIEQAAVGDDVRRWLRRGLDRAREARYDRPQHAILDIIFGGALTDLLARASQAQPRELPQSNISAQGIRQMAKGFGAIIQQRKGLAQALKRYPLPKYTISLKDSDTGFAEYWPRELSGRRDNELIIYVSDRTRNGDALDATLVHEVYPGHGLFYDLVRRGLPTFIDHGALGLVEGWATWCDWTFASEQYGRYARSARLRSLRTLQHDSADHVVRTIGELVVDNHETGTTAERLMLTFQYPGFAESYALGALWFESVLEPQRFLTFFDRLTGQPWGDFFRLWSRTDFT